MALAEIYERFGSRSVVAYSCKVSDSAPEGGFVIAVQNAAANSDARLKEYHRQLKIKYPARPRFITFVWKP